jgi:peptidoglycan/xylan/chitin deacetylase (PgdA/CDA1 family)
MTAPATGPWPDEARGALVVSFDFDGQTPHLWRSRNAPPSNIAELEQRRYGPRRGIYNVLDLLADLGIRSTFFVPGWIAAEYPHALDEIVAGGHELALHGWCHESPADLTASQLRETLVRASGKLAEFSGVAPRGYRSPSFQLTRESLEVLHELGLRYDSSLMGDDRPYRIGELIEVPVDWSTDDAIYYRYAAGTVTPPTSVADLTAAWSAEIGHAARRGTLCTLTMHPWLSGRPARIEALRPILQAARENPELWIGTVGDLADHTAALPVDVSPGRTGMTQLDLDAMEWPDAR